MLSGFVAEILHNSGYEVVFVDVLDSIIDALQTQPSYKVIVIGEDGEHVFTIDNYRAINSKYEDKVVREIATADIVTCSIGPNCLKFIAPVIAKAIENRKLDHPFIVIACENAINATDMLKAFVIDKLSGTTNIDAKALFANSAVDRIVPHQDPNMGLNIKVEKFYEWCVEKPPFHGIGYPDIKGIHFVDQLEPFIERKLFTLNTGHATAAYYGKQRGKKLIHDAMMDKEIHDIVCNVLRETAILIVQKHGISAQEQNAYVDEIVGRFINPALGDRVERVGRAPLRKLSRKERFIGPAAQLAERGNKVDCLLNAIEQAFMFQNVEDDDESVKLATILKTYTAPEVVAKVNGLEPAHPLYEPVLKIVERVQNKSK
jgi:mannitol-1-phosphate 5-dehydrogenase